MPPEITSALINSGPGADSLVEAAAAWQRLAALSEESAGADVSVLSSLVEVWDGVSATAMTEVAEPYLNWLRGTAQQCRQMGFAVEIAAAAFSAARSAVIAPTEVGANRTRLARLTAANRFGNNFVAIAATEAEYEGMWVTNAEAMYAYEAASARAVALPFFSSPPSAAGQGVSAAQASGAFAAPASAASVVSSLGVAAPGDLVNNAWFQLANTWGNQLLSSGFPLDLISAYGQMWQSNSAQIALDMAKAGMLPEAVEAAQTKLVGASGAVAPTSAVTAASGAGVAMGKLTVPPSVVGLLPASAAQVRLASAVSPLSMADAGLPDMPMVMPPPIPAGTGWRQRKQKYDDIAYGLELPGAVMRRSPSGG